MMQTMTTALGSSQMKTVHSLILTYMQLVDSTIDLLLRIEGFIDVDI